MIKYENAASKLNKSNFSTSLITNKEDYSLVTVKHTNGSTIQFVKAPTIDWFFVRKSYHGYDVVNQAMEGVYLYNCSTAIKFALS